MPFFVRGYAMDMVWAASKRAARCKPTLAVIPAKAGIQWLIQAIPACLQAGMTIADADVDGWEK